MLTPTSMLIQTNRFLIRGLPWSGIRGMGRAVLECAQDDWSAQVIPLAGGRAQGHSRVPAFALIAHPAAWYADLWRHRRLPIACGLGDPVRATDPIHFCGGVGRGVLTRALTQVMGCDVEQIAPIRVEHFVADLRRANLGNYKVPNPIMPMFREVQDELADRRFDPELAEMVLDSEPVFRQWGYSADPPRCGGQGGDRVDAGRDR